MADCGRGEMEKKLRRPDTTGMWSGELDADVAAAEAYTLSPGTVEDMFAHPEDVSAAYEEAPGLDPPVKSTDSEAAAIDSKQKPKKGVAGKVKEKLTTKVKDLITGPKPINEGEEVEGPVGYVHRGPVPGQGLAAPAMTGRPVGTRDVHRKENMDKLVAEPNTEGAVHGGLGVDNSKKEGVMSKLKDKLHLGANRP